MANKFPIGNQFQRLNNFPLDETTVFDTLAQAQDYASNNPTAYSGQVIHVKDARTDEEKLSDANIYEESYYIDNNKEIKPICSFSLEALGVLFDLMYAVLDGSTDLAREKFNELYPLLGTIYNNSFDEFLLLDHKTTPWDPRCYDEYQICLEMTQPTEGGIIGKLVYDDSSVDVNFAAVNTSYEIENITVNRNGVDEYYKVITFNSLPARPWFTYGDYIKRVISMIDLSEETDLNRLFDDCTNLTEIIGIEDWNVSKVWTFNRAFTLCRSLTSLDLSKWDTSSLTDASQMFNVCTSLISLDISNWITSNITQMDYMFSGDSSLVDLNMSNWNIQNINRNNTVGIFDYCDSLDFGGINLTGVDYTSYGILEARYIGRAR